MPDTLSHLEGGYLRLQNDIANRLISKEPIEKYYDITEEPFARGKYAMVRRCRERSTGRVFAAKYLRKRNRSKDYRKEILHEVAVLEACKPCSNIVTLHQVFETPSDMVLMLELACGGEVQSLVDGEQVPTEATVQLLMRQILKGILYLHHINVAHLDIKPQNVIMTGPIPNCEVKLCDFGISRYLSEGTDVREILGTPDYVAPEVLNYEPISLATDMWSVGVLLYVLLSGCSPFGGETKQETFCNISQGRLDFPEDLFEDISEEAKDLMTKLMVINPSSRLTAEQCLKHAWFAKVFSESSTKNGGLTVRNSTICMPSSKPTTPVPSKRVVPPETKVVLEETVTMTHEEEEDNNNIQQNNNNVNNNNVNNNNSRGMGRTRGLSDERRRSLHSNLQNLIERLDNEELTTPNPTRRVSRNDSFKRASAMQTMPSIRYGKDSGGEILSEQVYKFQRVVLVDEDEGLPPSPASSSADNSSDSSSDTVSEMSIDSSSDRSSIISLDDSLDFHHHFNAAGRMMRQYASCTNVWEATRRQVPNSRQCNETFLRAMSKFREDEIKIGPQVRSKFDVFHSSRLSLPQTTTSNSELGRKCIGVEFVRERNGNLVVIREVRAIQGKKYSQTRELKCESVQSRIRKLLQLKTEQFDNSVF